MRQWYRVTLLPEKGYANNRVLDVKVPWEDAQDAKAALAEALSYLLHPEKWKHIDTIFETSSGSITAATTAILGARDEP